MNDIVDSIHDVCLDTPFASNYSLFYGLFVKGSSQPTPYPNSLERYQGHLTTSFFHMMVPTPIHSFQNPSHCSLLSREPAPSPQLIPIFPEYENAGNTRRRQRSEQAGTRTDANANIHLRAEQDRSECQRRSSEVIAREQRGSILRIDERQVDEDALHEDEDAHGEQEYSDDADEPVDMSIARPAE